jgi:hypothetical protein
VGSLTSHNPIGLHGLLRGSLHLFTCIIINLEAPSSDLLCTHSVQLSPGHVHHRLVLLLLRSKQLRAPVTQQTLHFMCNGRTSISAGTLTSLICERLDLSKLITCGPLTPCRTPFRFGATLLISFRYLDAATVSKGTHPLFDIFRRTEHNCIGCHDNSVQEPALPIAFKNAHYYFD